MACKHEDEFNYREALKRLDSITPPKTMALSSIERIQWVSGDVQARALVSIAQSLRRIESRLCDKDGGGTAAS